VLNDGLDVLEQSVLNDTIVNDYVSFFSKLIIGSLSLFCLLMIQPYLINQKINQFEYILLILFIPSIKQTNKFLYFSKLPNILSLLNYSNVFNFSRFLLLKSSFTYIILLF
jgi:hypothetical protein